MVWPFKSGLIFSQLPRECCETDETRADKEHGGGFRNIGWAHVTAAKGRIRDCALRALPDAMATLNVTVVLSVIVLYKKGWGRGAIGIRRCLRARAVRSMRDLVCVCV